MGATVGLTQQSYICLNCSGMLWNELIYRYREKIENLVPAHVQSRPKCWYGKECRTQRTKPIHAQKYNHIGDNQRT
jgi:E3 ubiquitin-protein ligase CHFR